MSVKVEGIDAIIEHFDKIADVRNLEKALGESCALVEASAKQKAPKDTGALRRSIESNVNINGNELIGTVFTPLEYAPYVEYGTGLFAKKGGRKNVPWKYQDDNGVWHSTKGQHPQPFMKPSLDENRKKIVETLKEGINK